MRLSLRAAACLAAGARANLLHRDHRVNFARAAAETTRPPASPPFARCARLHASHPAFPSTCPLTSRALRPPTTSHRRRLQAAGSWIPCDATPSSDALRRSPGTGSAAHASLRQRRCLSSHRWRARRLRRRAYAPGAMRRAGVGLPFVVLSGDEIDDGVGYRSRRRAGAETCLPRNSGKTITPPRCVLSRRSRGALSEAYPAASCVSAVMRRPRASRSLSSIQRRSTRASTRNAGLR